MQHVTECPVCQGNNFSDYLSCKDYTVSHETFQLRQCTACEFIVTSPRPEEKDLGKYYLSDAYISHSDKSPSLIDQVYKVSRMFTLKWKYHLVKKYTVQSQHPASLLDFGCGTGMFLQTCEKNRMNTAGVEPSGIARSIAIKNSKAEIATDIKAVEQQFDAITLWHVLEHVEKINDTLRDLKNHLRENGTMFIAVPNLQSRDARKYQAYWAGYDVPRHLWHFSAKTMKRLLKKHELRLINIEPMRLDAYYVSMLSEKYKIGKNTLSNLGEAAIQGWKSNIEAKTTQEYSSLIYIARK